MGSLVIDLGNSESVIRRALGNNQLYVYKDFDMNMVLKDNKLDIIAAEDLAAIYDSLLNIFIYNKGERALKPDFGTDLRALLYEPMTENTVSAMKMEIYNAISKWEPRINIENITITPNYDFNEYQVKIGFTCKQIRSSQTYFFNHSLKTQI
jgi:phage baseplate assembly protein W